MWQWCAPGWLLIRRLSCGKLSGYTFIIHARSVIRALIGGIFGDACGLIKAVLNLASIHYEREVLNKFPTSANDPVLDLLGAKICVRTLSDIFISSFHAKIKLLRLGRAEGRLLMSRRFVREKNNRNLGCGRGRSISLNGRGIVEFKFTRPWTQKHHPESLLLIASFPETALIPLRIWRA